MRYEQNTILVEKFTNKTYYKNKLYPNIPISSEDIFVITTIGDRLDLLAYTYYKNPEYWWIISMANNNVTKGSMFPQPGTQLRIPLNVNEVLRTFNELNN
jgi:nucleoid-associated protein YgaU